ncbi:Xcc1710-like domain-containing protein [Diaphorobacter sp. HDW4A]|uniref:Mth938-like domain-containing protein n=1 Tax=Diaphorobacter sp. HDW4A TaxID=2714924 RepID=UPI0014093CA0|nr:Mth938-like domain-containing protein [Diaphorobacter sp. HDW4A]QIL78745.1 Xcc1710-like domain-containing protein [Diaphorobacter sp. HDW4A]
MKLHADRFDVQTISGYGPDWVAIDREEFRHSLIIGSRGERIEWNCERFEDLTPAHFAQLADLGAEVVIFGSGQKNRFPTPAWLAPLMAKRLGVESMNTQAACRTYNILAGEGRHVIAALLLEKKQ